MQSVMQTCSHVLVTLALLACSTFATECPPGVDPDLQQNISSSTLEPVTHRAVAASEAVRASVSAGPHARKDSLSKLFATAFRHFFSHPDSLRARQKRSSVGRGFLKQLLKHPKNINPDGSISPPYLPPLPPSSAPRFTRPQHQDEWDTTQQDMPPSSSPPPSTQVSSSTPSAEQEATDNGARSGVTTCGLMLVLMQALLLAT